MTCDLLIELRNVVNMARCTTPAPPERNAAPGIDPLSQLIPLLQILPCSSVVLKVVLVKDP